VAAELLAEGKYLETGALAPEAAFEPNLVFAKLADYDLKIALAQKQKCAKF